MIRHHANFYTNRLAKEWLKNGKIIIACDLDDTIIPYNEEIKENCNKMVKLIMESQEEHKSNKKYGCQNKEYTF